MTKPKVTVIIVNYNTKPFLKKCINNLYGEGSYSNLDIVVVDNSSTDGSLQMVKKDFPKVKAILSPNKGLAYGFNKALKAVSKTDYILFLGSDAYPKRNCIVDMVAKMESDKSIGISTPKLITKSGKIDMDSHRGFPTPWVALTHFSKLNRLFPKSKIFNGYFMEYQNLNTDHEIDMCISHFMLVRKSVVKKLAGFSEDYFLYGEDVDFCYRAKQEGYKVMYFGSCESLHYKGVSVGVRKESKDITKASNKTKKRAKKASVKSMEIFYNKHYSRKYPRVVTFSVLGGIKFMSFLRNKLSNAFK